VGSGLNVDQTSHPGYKVDSQLYLTGLLRNTDENLPFGHVWVTPEWVTPTRECFFVVREKNRFQQLCGNCLNGTLPHWDNWSGSHSTRMYTEVREENLRIPS